MGKVTFTGLDKPSEEVEADDVLGHYDGGTHREIEISKGKFVKVRESMADVETKIAAGRNKKAAKDKA